MQKNYSYYSYPLQVLATNRTVDSLISRRKSERPQGPRLTLGQVPGVKMVLDIRDIMRVAGFKGLYRGLSPYIMSQVINDITIQSNPQTVRVLQAQTLLFCIDLLFWNPF